MRAHSSCPLEIERQYNESQMSERSGKSPALTLSRVRMRKDQHNRGRRRIEPSRSIYESRQSGHLGGMLQPERRLELVQDDLALGARRRTRSTYALSITGAAGPEPGTEKVPKGTMYVGLADA